MAQKSPEVLVVDVVRLEVSNVAKLWRKLTGRATAQSGDTAVRLDLPPIERPPEHSAATVSEDIPQQPSWQPVPGVTLLRTLSGHELPVRCLAFDPEGRTLASGSSDATIKLWEVSSGLPLHTIEGHFRNTVFSVAFDPQGHTLASGTDKGMVEQREVSSGNLLQAYSQHSNCPVFSVAYDSQGRLLAGGTDRGAIELWEATSGHRLGTLDGHEQSVYCVAIDPEGRKLASGGNDRTIKLWDVNSGRLLRTTEGHTRAVRSVAFDPTGRTVASASSDSTIKLWEVNSGRMLGSLKGHASRIEAIAYSSDGRLLASKGREGTIRIWNCATWQTVAIIPEPTFSNWWISALAFHPTLPLLASAGSPPETPEALRSRVVHLWELDVETLLSGKIPAPAIPEVHAQVEPLEDIPAERAWEAPIDHRQTNLENERNYRTECLDR